MARFFLVLFFLSNSLLSAKTFRADVDYLGEGAREFMIRGLYYSTLSFYNENLEEIPLNNSDDSFEQVDGDIFSRFTYGKKTEFFISPRGRFLRSFFQNKELSNYALESVLVGLQYHIGDQETSWKMALDFSYRYKFFTNLTSDELILGDDGHEYYVGITLGKTYSSFQHISIQFGHLGFSNYLSGLLTSRASFTFFSDDWFLSLGANGSYSIGEDGYANNLSKRPTFSQGITKKFNSINQFFFAPSLSIGHNMKWAQIEYQFSKSVYGRSYDSFMEHFVALKWFTGPHQSYFEKKDESFKQYFIEGSVIKISPRGRYLVIDQGLSADVEKGNYFDIFMADYKGENILVATGIVEEVEVDKSVIKLLKKYKTMRIKKGFIARGR